VIFPLMLNTLIIVTGSTSNSKTGWKVKSYRFK